MIKKRQSNIELLRIVAMFLVLVVHADYASLGRPTLLDIEINPMSSSCRIFTQSFSIVCVNLFVIISGYFGINYKIRSSLGLIFQIIFWRIIVCVAVCVLGLQTFSFGMLIDILPGSNDWFVRSYLLLILFSPIVNVFVENISSKNLLRFIVAFYVIQTIFGWLLPIWEPVFCSGYSTISMLGLYLIGRYMKLYGQNLLKYKTTIYWSGYFVISLLAAGIMILLTFIVENNTILTYFQNRFTAYVSPVVILSSICLFVAFVKMDFSSRIVNWIATSVFSVYLVHCNPYVFEYYTKICSDFFEQYNTCVYVGLMLVLLLGIFIVSVFVDKVRIQIWRMMDSLIINKYPFFRR